MKMTRRGVVYDLEHSPYIYEDKGISYYFSSVNHMEKFREQQKANRETLAYSLYRRFKIKIVADTLFDLVLYAKVETRGFLVEVGGEKHKWLKSLKFDGVIKIENKSNIL